MSWLLSLYETYEKNSDQIGAIHKRREDEAYTLLPVSHSTQNAQIEVTVDLEGNFYDAVVVEKKNATTVIPCTEASFSRTSKAVPHPLHDKLMYVAGDFEHYGGVVKKGSPFNDYIEQLREWCDSSHAHPKVIAIYHYLKKGTLIKDLVNKAILRVDEKHQLIKKWTKKEEEKYGDKPDIFKVMSETQDKVFVRFDVHEVGKVNTSVWNDTSIYDAFVAYYKGKLQEDDMCYITGKMDAKTDRHASKIRHAADMAKLISANDTDGFTFKGRFINANDVANVSFDVSQKAHNALKWLILKQGKVVDGRVFLVWGNESTEVPSPQDDLHDWLVGIGSLDERQQQEAGDRTHEVFARAFNKAIAGYKSNLSYESKVMLLILDAATPGRLSVMYYRSMNIEDYFTRIDNWAKTCSWLHAYKRDEQKQIIRFYGPPAPRDIALAAYGSHASDKVIKGLMERMLACIVDGQKIPLDVIRSALARASNPVSMDEWEWTKTLSITCALLKKHYEKEEYDVALDVNCKERDYLFGRLLAIADVLEKRALYSADEKRATNAIRYMNAFSRHPARTWQVIQANLQPYQARLGDQVFSFNRLIDEVASDINLNDFNDKPLSGLYLLGFYSQRHELFKSKKQKEKEQLENTNL
ncbi:CRISPR-associated protein Csd1 [Pullulanibacillus pueri]|uniref:Type I-C CRISPR-associated protein Cas8c/Csd1 n=1 Tax=Pullulanibacillus pueri TaxID=1437324 RepID=A0A8J3EMB4_9BACL|nr:type I-C CRISPR-associated protein Cas8c/Csd1 [Pullulanibacillus pueri]MBM7682121.1 CRISPR-associated protein Csd1 [Pullulanibacillus pueri]GGH79897.1 type I-C CRISPR-associated protein Cas8c/Csd1 [Pullulanibacillus pueri]